MAKLDEAKTILAGLGLPRKQQGERSCLTLLALAALKEETRDTAKKHVVLDEASLKSLRIPVNRHDKLPDVVLFDSVKKWIFLIEAVTSHGPVSPKRHRELEKLLARCDAARIYVTAFLHFADFRKYASDIVWESEVWIAESPDHMIHYDGQRFLGPYRKSD